MQTQPGVILETMTIEGSWPQGQPLARDFKPQPGLMKAEHT
jgi:hypothetical protein